MRPSTDIVKLAIFASGRGSNAQKLVEYFWEHPFIVPVLVVTNNKTSGVLHITKKYDIRKLIIVKEDFCDNKCILNILQEEQVDLIILAGFLWKIPEFILRNYQDRIINIHPSLLPKYGGKGMYGENVHRAVLQSGDTISGITIHLVNEEYDQGKILFQKECPVYNDDTPQTLAERIRQLEHQYFAKVIEDYAKQVFRKNFTS